jgi:CheY-like chemotaxis protein
MDATSVGGPGQSEKWTLLQVRRANAKMILPETEPTPNLSMTTPASNGCVLIVDDNQAVRETLADLVESDGFCPVQAADAAEALMILRDRTDIVALVTDLSMPGADGITLIRHARQLYPNLPAILLTGYAEETASVSTIAGGNFHVLRKPVQSDRLIEQIFLLIAQTGITQPSTD